MNTSRKVSMPDDIADLVSATVEVVKETGVEEMKPVEGEPLPSSPEDYNNPMLDIGSVKLKEGERFLSPEEANARRAKLRQQNQVQQ